MEVKKILSESDVDKCVGLFVKVFAEPPWKENWSAESARQHLLETYLQGKDFCFYAEQDSRVIAFIFGRGQTWDDGRELFIDEAGVDPLFRGKGVGKLMFEHLEDYCREKEIVSVSLGTNVKAGSFEFWKKMGFLHRGYVLMHKKLK
ncbi:GNAT family N-acetyltransferase [Candidatus Woesearchaeota archaeon]|nr:GNAT family N-acetyltransferase [Candidatus Woesearchaeota archaeon]